MEYLFAADTIAAPGFDPERDRRVQRAGRQAGLRRVRACAARRFVALLRPRSAGSAGPSDRRFPRHVPLAHDRLACTFARLWGRTILDSRFTRRQVIGGSTRLGLALAVGLPLLQACGDDGASSSSGKNTEAIKDGLNPRPGRCGSSTTTRTSAPTSSPSFEAKYGVKVEITTITTDDEAITKLASGAIDVDLDHSASTHDVVQADRHRADPAAQQELPHQHRQRRLPRCATRTTTRAACTPFPTPLFSTGIGFRADRVDAATVVVGHAVEPRVQGRHVAARRRARGTVRGDVAQGPDRHQHRPIQAVIDAGRRRPGRADQH